MPLRVAQNKHETKRGEPTFLSADTPKAYTILYDHTVVGDRNVPAPHKGILSSREW